MRQLDPVSLGIMWDRLNAVTNEITTALVRTSFSTIVRESYDLSVVLFDAKGRPISQGRLSAPGHSGTAANTVRYIAESFPIAEMRPGDLFITNDPWHGTGHIYDMNFVRPAFRRGELVGFTFSDTHMADMGGVGFSANTADKFAEGLHLPACRLMRDKVLDRTIISIIRSNVRVADQVIGDMMANVTCNELGERLLVEFMDEYEIDDLSVLADALLGQSERAMRAAIRLIPDGVYANRVQIEGLGTPLTLAVTCDVRDDEIHVDFAGTDGLVQGGVNVPFCYTRAMSIFALRLLTVPTLPANDGSTRPLHFSAPENCILNALPPAPTAGRHVVGHFVTPLVIGAFADALPHRVQAQSGMMDLVSIQGRRGDGREISTMFFGAGGYGAMDGMDGMATIPTPASMRVTPTEVWEHLYGTIIESKRLIPDSGGAGRYRGGLGQEIVMCNDRAGPLALAFFGRQTAFPPAGIRGGAAGSPHGYAIEGRPVPPIGRSTLQTGERLVIRLPGGGGYGEPRSRDPERILQDVRDGFVSVDGARRDYGVQVDVENATVRSL
ncbi:hydantoinase B/oxoprolinase family protein [Vineibacter terrae]|uniref:hydantoinase B/oxoprolinase family protein n=1 Tax=Vineibacter terrae TaxID=2586908 RepID=UPI002E3817E2|nr:hydantoinase B/oxoprolinase family protein [Vineibacter terrae]HEX2892316.1 hydantoinase B/oxoprolinase family protein [Vineibacter terrae]